MIARIWHGVTEQSKGDEFLDYVMETGAKDYRATPGNRGVYVLRSIGEGKAEFLMISLWESLEAIKKFAGEDIENAVYYYPKDKEFLLELEPNVKHYEVLASS